MKFKKGDDLAAARGILWGVALSALLCVALSLPWLLTALREAATR